MTIWSHSASSPSQKLTLCDIYNAAIYLAAKLSKCLCLMKTASCWKEDRMQTEFQGTFSTLPVKICQQYGGKI